MGYIAQLKREIEKLSPAEQAEISEWFLAVGLDATNMDGRGHDGSERQYVFSHNSDCELHHHHHRSIDGHSTRSRGLFINSNEP